MDNGCPTKTAAFGANVGVRLLIPMSPLKLHCYRLLQTTEHAAALRLLADTKSNLQAMAADAQGHKAGAAGLMFIQYLENNWFAPELWSGWSQKGRNDAAARMAIDVEGILPTTNHLESFNASLKYKHIPEWRHSGRRLRFDMLIFHLIVHILPDIYAQHCMVNDYRVWRVNRFRSAAGGIDISKQISDRGASSTSTNQYSPPRAWYEPDEARDSRAQVLFSLRHIQPIQSGRPFELWATCPASDSNISNPQHSRYWLTAHPSGIATCTCPDWLHRGGGACKHLRAFRWAIQSWQEAGQLAYHFHFPSSRQEAHDIDTQNRCYYGANHDRAVSCPLHSPYCSCDPPARTIESNTGSMGLLPPRNMTHIVPSLEQVLEVPELAEDADACSDSALEQGSDVDSCVSIDPSPEASCQQVAPECEPSGHPGIQRARDVAGVAGADPKVRCRVSESTHISFTVLTNVQIYSPPDIENTNRHAVQLQIKHRIEHDVAKILPTLHGIASQFEGSTVRLPSTNPFLEFQDVIVQLHEALGHAIYNSPISDLKTADIPPHGYQPIQVSFVLSSELCIFLIAGSCSSLSSPRKGKMIF